MPSTRVNVLRPDSRHHRLDGNLASDLLTCGTSMLTREEQTDDHRCICLRRVSPSSFTTPHTHTTQRIPFDITHWHALDKSFQSRQLHLRWRRVLLGENVSAL